MCHVTDESSHICEWGIEVAARFGSVLLQKMSLQCDVAEMNYVTDEPSDICT